MGKLLEHLEQEKEYKNIYKNCLMKAEDFIKSKGLWKEYQEHVLGLIEEKKNDTY